MERDSIRKKSGSILEDRNGWWYMRFQVGGQKVHRTTGLRATSGNHKKASALSWKERDRINLEVRFGERQVQPKGFCDTADEFLKLVKIEHRPRTYCGYRDHLKPARIFFKQRPVSTIQAGDLEDFKVWRVTTRQVSLTTIRHSLATMSVMFEYAKRKRWCLKNPVHDIKIPPADKVDDRVLSYDEERRYFAAAADPRRPRYCGWIVSLMLLQGLRTGEVLNLRKEDVDLESGKLHVRDSKTRESTRVLDLIEESRHILLEAMQHDSPWFFPGKGDSSKHVGLQALTSVHKTIVKAAGISHFRQYIFRHTFATRMGEAGTDPFTLAKILGHCDTNTLRRYVHVTDPHQKAAMEQYQRIRRSSTLGDK